MGVFSELASDYEHIAFGHDPETGLRTIIAVYSTVLGPALGGTRFWPFPDEEAALRDVLRLSKAMAYKASAAGLDLGGGKAVVIGDPARDKSDALLRAYGRVVQRLGGAYITTADVGTTMADMDVIASTTQYVTGTSSGSGDPSPVTAFGVFHGLQAVAEHLWGDTSLRGRRIVVQGTGKVGGALARHLADAGVVLTLSDINVDACGKLAAELGADVVEPEKAPYVECDIFAPCALGSVVNDASIGGLACRAIAGAANNQLERADHGDALHAQGILYAPDYVINAGGLINVADELRGYDAARAHATAAAIGPRLRGIFERSKAEGVSPAVAADRTAEDRINAGRG